MNAIGCGRVGRVVQRDNQTEAQLARKWRNKVQWIQHSISRGTRFSAQKDFNRSETERNGGDRWPHRCRQIVPHFGALQTHRAGRRNHFHRQRGHQKTRFIWLEIPDNNHTSRPGPLHRHSSSQFGSIQPLLRHWYLEGLRVGTSEDICGHFGEGIDSSDLWRRRELKCRTKTIDLFGESSVEED